MHHPDICRNGFAIPPFFILALYHIKTKSTKRRCVQQDLFSSSLMPVHLSVCPKTTGFIITRTLSVCQYPMQEKVYKLHLKSSKSSIFLFLGIVLMLFFYFPVFFGFRIKKDYTNNCFFPFAFCSTVFLYLFQILLRERILPDAKTDF